MHIIWYVQNKKLVIFYQNLVKNMEISVKKIKENFTYREVTFSPKKIITDSKNNDNEEFGVIVEGTVLVESIDENGIRRVLDFYTEGDFFWQRAIKAAENKGYYMHAQRKCRVWFLKTAENADNESVEELITQMNLEMHTRLLSHIDILEQHSLRKKLTAFIKYYIERKRRNPFKLAMGLTDCADYIGADRSAMMRELGRMEKEGIIKHKGRSFKLL